MLISVIIATYNRCENLKLVFDSLLLQNKRDGFDYEVLLVDNNSKDKTKDTVIEYQEKFAGRLNYFFEARQGKSFAMNLGIKESKGDILFFTDDDIILDNNWFIKIIECYEKHGCDAVGGRVLPTYPPGTPSWVNDYAFKLSGAVVIYDNGEGTFPVYKKNDRFIGANFSVKRSVFKEIGDIRTDIGSGTGIIGEDAEFYNRLIADKKIVYYCGEALIWHPFDSKRLTLKHIAKWSIELGAYMALCDIEERRKFILLFGIPRYIFRGIISDFFGLIFSSWSKPRFYIAWRNFYCKIGIFQGYQRFSKKVKHA